MGFMIGRSARMLSRPLGRSAVTTAKMFSRSTRNVPRSHGGQAGLATDDRATGPNTGQTEEKSFPVCTDRFIRVRKEHPARHEQARVTDETRAGAKNCGRNVVSVWYLRFTDRRMRWCVSGRRRFPIDCADPWEKCSRGTVGKCDYWFCFRLFRTLAYRLTSFSQNGPYILGKIK